MVFKYSKAKCLFRSLLVLKKDFFFLAGLKKVHCSQFKESGCGLSPRKKNCAVIFVHIALLCSKEVEVMERFELQHRCSSL